MSTWHRTDDRGIPVQFTATPDERGNVSLTVQELEGLMRTGGWHASGEPVPAEELPALSFDERVALMARTVAGSPLPVAEAARRLTELFAPPKETR